MNIPNDKLLASYRTSGNCEHCGKFCSMRVAAHVFSKSAGRIDHPLNLVHLGMNPVTDCVCHANSHSTPSPSRMDFLRIVSKREGVPVQLIVDSIAAVRACPRYSTATKSWLWLLEKFPREVAEGAFKIIKDSGIYE